MAITAAQLQVVLTADTKGAESGMKRVSDSADKGSGKLKGLLNNMLQIATGVGAADLAGAAFGFLRDQLMDSYNAGLQANAVMAQTVAHLKSTHDASGLSAKGVADLASQLSDLTGIDDDTVQSSENMLLTFTNIGKNVFPQATQAAADMATTFNNGMTPSAQQMQDVSIQLGKALNDPIHGITALQRVGVTFTDAQKKQIATMMKHHDVAGAQKVILKELNKEFGGSAKAAGDANGGMSKLTAKMNDMKEKIGQALIPIVTNLVSILVNKVIPAAQQVGDKIGQFVGFLQTHEDAMDAFKAILGGIAIAIAIALIPAFVAWAVSAGAAAIATIAATAPVILIGLAIGLLIFGIIELVKHWKDVSKWLENTWHAVAKKVGDGFSALGAKAHQLWETIKAKFIAGIVWFDSIPGRIRSAIQNNIVKPLEDTIKGVIKNAMDWGKNLIQTFINGLMSKLGDLKNAGTNLMNGLKNILGFHSPAKEGPGADADTWAPNLVHMFSGGLEAGGPDAAKAAKGVMLGVKGALSAGASGTVTLQGLASASVTSAATSAAAAAVGAGGGASGDGRPIQLVLDNGALRVLATALLPYQTQAIRNAVGIRNK